jgi:hypothetical protein
MTPCINAFRKASTSNEHFEKTADLRAYEHDERVPDDQVGFPQRDEGYKSDSAGEENFDEIEASAQELHDIVLAMMHYLRRTDPDQTKAVMSGCRSDILFGGRRQHERVAIPSALHGGRARGFASKKDFDAATTLFLELGPKLMLHLRKDVMDRMLGNTRQVSTMLSDNRLKRRQNLVERTKIMRFRQASHYRHAPFEIQNLRSDIPNSYVDHSRAHRDRGTISGLKALLEPQHPFRHQLELRMFEICEEISSSTNVPHQP